MRTTLEIDDDVLRAARSIAAAEDKSVGKALSDLARRGLARKQQSKSRARFPVFDVLPDASPITLELTREALDDESCVISGVSSSVSS